MPRVTAPCLSARLCFLAIFSAVVILTGWRYHTLILEWQQRKSIPSPFQLGPGHQTWPAGSPPNATDEDFMVVADYTPPRLQPTGEINRDFAKFAAPQEDFFPELNEAEKNLVLGLRRNSSHDDRVRQLYSMNGAQAWQGYIQSLDDDLVLPLTKFTQAHIHAHQHPATCHDKRFLVMNHFADKNGLGTVIHGIGFMLSLALRHDLVLIYNLTQDRAPGRHFVERDCLGRGLRSLDCIYEPLTSCDLFAHVDGTNSLVAEAYWDPPDEIEERSGTVPPLLGAAMRSWFPDIKPNALKYWWRAQAAAYVMRLNGPATTRVREMRLDGDMHAGFSRDGRTGEVRTVAVPFPLPTPSFSMHVRHGDKGVEMELVPFTAYVLRAERHCAENPLSCQKTAFLSTEDDAIFASARAISTLMRTSTTANSDWTWFHSHIPRINGGPREQLDAFGNRTETTLRWTLQLLMAAVECDTFVGTRGSGWVRLVDELRCVWSACAKAYLEVGRPEDWIHYNY